MLSGDLFPSRSQITPDLNAGEPAKNSDTVFRVTLWLDDSLRDSPNIDHKAYGIDHLVIHAKNDSNAGRIVGQSTT